MKIVRSREEILLKTILTLVSMWFVSGVILAQTARLLRFEPAVMEIDTVRYDAGPVKVRFVCTNISDKDVVIVDVHSQCGCAKPSFSRAAIHPGEYGHVDVTLNPEHLFAGQNRHLTVIATNGDYRKFNTITVHGYVDRGVTEEEIRYPYELAPGFRSDIHTLGMRLSKKGEVSLKEFTVYNDSDGIMTLGWKFPDGGMDYGRENADMGRSGDGGHSVWIYVWADVPFVLMPHESAKIRVWADTRNIPIGTYEMPLMLYANGHPAVILLKGAVSE